MTPLTAKYFASLKIFFSYLSVFVILLTVVVLIPHQDVPHSFKSNFPLLIIRVHQEEHMLPYSDVYVNATLGIIAEKGVDTRYSIYFPNHASKKKRYHNTYPHPFDPKAIVKSYNVGIHVRGQSTRITPKKQYALKFYDDKYEDTDVPLFGMPEGNKWILSSGGVDPIITRNTFGFYLWSLMGMYAPRIQYVEVFLVYGDGEVTYPERYKGVYMLTEKIVRDKNRVDIKKMSVDDDSDPSKITGGYIYKVDKSDANSSPEDIKFETNFTVSLYLIYPSGEVATQAKVDYLRSYINNFEEILQSRSTNGTKYSDLIVVHTFVDTLIMQEFSKNIDAYRLSSYYYKDRNKQINSGPIWDLDRTWGNTPYEFAYITTGYMYNSRHPVMGASFIPTWWPNLMNDLSFVKKVLARYQELRSIGNPLSDDVVFTALDNLYKELRESDAIQRDYYRWGPWWYRFCVFWPDYHTHYYNSLRSFIKQRLEWLDNNFEDRLALASEPE